MVLVPVCPARLQEVLWPQRRDTGTLRRFPGLIRVRWQQVVSLLLRGLSGIRLSTKARNSPWAGRSPMAVQQSGGRRTAAGT
jgi:hypothetical protein